MRTRGVRPCSHVRMFASLPGRKDRTAASAAAYSYLLVATDARSTSRDRLRAMPCQKEENERSEVKSTKTIRMSLSRDRRSAALKRAPDAGLQANRPRFLTLRLHAVLLPLQAIMRNTSRRETRRITPVYSHIYLLIYDCSASTYSAKASRPASVMRHTVQGILPRKVFSTSM